MSFKLPNNLRCRTVTPLLQLVNGVVEGLQLLKLSLQLLLGECLQRFGAANGLLDERLQCLDLAEPDTFCDALLASFFLEFLCNSHGFGRKLSIVLDRITDSVEVNGLVDVQAVDEAFTQQLVFQLEGQFGVQPVVEIKDAVLEACQLHQVQDDTQFGLVLGGGIDLSEVDQEVVEGGNELTERTFEVDWNLIEIAELGGGGP